VRRLRLDLEPWRKTRAVKELDEQLALAGKRRPSPILAVLRNS
jgi:hypothetical protein